MMWLQGVMAITIILTCLGGSVMSGGMKWRIVKREPEGVKGGGTRLGGRAQRGGKKEAPRHRHRVKRRKVGEGKRAWISELEPD